MAPHSRLPQAASTSEFCLMDAVDPCAVTV